MTPKRKGKSVKTNDENISISILRIYQMYRQIFGKKISIDLQLIKTYENIEKNSKNDIINNNRHFKVVL